MIISTVLSIVGKLMCFVRRNEISAMWVWYPPPWSIHPICCCTTLFLSTHSWNETITTTKIAWKWLSWEVVLGDFEDWSYLEPIGLRNPTKLLSKDHINWYNSTKKPILKISMRNLSIQGLYDPWDLIDLDFLLIWKLPFIAHWYVDCSWLVAATLRNLA